MIWQIALATPLPQCFDYLPPDSCEQTPLLGARVRVPFGSRKLVGIFLRVTGESQVELSKLKCVYELLDSESLFPNQLFKLCEWISQYYHYPFGEVLSGALPKFLREGQPIPQTTVKQYALTQAGKQTLEGGLKRALKQKSTLKKLTTPLLEEELKANAIDKSILSKLLEKKWVAVTELAPFEHLTPRETELPFSLNSDQSYALKKIKESEVFKVFLLAGVTGSGKTEVYLQAIQAVLEKKKQALILVPEISLTPQTLSRFTKRFAVTIAVLHSGLSDKERARMWALAYKGEASIVIGTRSAIFAPLSNLGLIVVDEEHDNSFKSQAQLRYNARDLAVMRSHFENIPVILGSATPALESFFNVKQSRYELLTLPERAGEAVAPKIRVIDLKGKQLKTGLSAELIESIRAQLANHKQVLLFLNRRGFAPVMLCHGCGYTLECARCDARLIYHKIPPRLVCHHCEKVSPPLRVCPKCKQAELITLGQGTEQLEHVLSALFPHHKVLRIDRDTVTTRERLHEKLTEIHEGSADILIGTQMLAKGHHFPRLGLSAIVDLDSSFFSVDFRAIERMAQLILQVGGRAGRSKEIGEVIIQTHQSGHPLLNILIKQGYFAFLEELLKERKLAKLPPYSFHVVLRADAKSREGSLNFLRDIKALITRESVQVAGPLPALMERKAGRFRAHLLLQSSCRKQLKKAVEPVLGKLNELGRERRVRWVVDVDPLEIG